MLGVALAGARGSCGSTTCGPSGTGADVDAVPLLQVAQQGRSTAADEEFPIPVYVFWDTVNHQHTFHFPPAWKNEVQDNIQFYAYGNPHGGMEPVRVFWDDVNKQHTFHLDGPWKNEQQGNILYYVSRTEKPGMVPIRAFWDTVNKQHTFHPWDSWKKEVKDAVQFWAYPTRPDTADPRYCMPHCPAHPSPDFVTSPIMDGFMPLMGGSVVTISGRYSTVSGDKTVECAMEGATEQVWCAPPDGVDDPSERFRLVDAGAIPYPGEPDLSPKRFFALQARNGLYCSLVENPIAVRCNSTAIGRNEKFEMKLEPFPVTTIVPWGDANSCFIWPGRFTCSASEPRSVMMRCADRCGTECADMPTRRGKEWGNGEDCRKAGFTAKDGCSKRGWTCEAYQKFGWCVGGGPAPCASSKFGKAFRKPEEHCCMCGGGTVGGLDR